MISCKQVSRLVSESLDRPLTLRERFWLRLHLWRCGGCSNFSGQMKSLRAAMRRLASGAADPPPPPHPDPLPASGARGKTDPDPQRSPKNRD